MARLKILVVGDPASIHATRFLSLLQEIGYDTRLYQCEHYYWQEEHLRDSKVYVSFIDQPAYNGNLLEAQHAIVSPFNHLLTRFVRLSSELCTTYALRCPKTTRARPLADVIAGWKPEVIFSLKMQNDGYTLLAAREMLGNRFKAKWVHFSWGTDFEFFGKHPRYAEQHLPLIRKVLAVCDFHIADCQRDLRSGRQFGFQGQSLGTTPAFGGFDLCMLENLRQHSGGQRDIILIKGREGGLVGRALNVIQALRRITPLLEKYRIRVIMPSSVVHRAVRRLAHDTAIDIDVVPRIPYAQLLSLYARSRVAISASEVDGAPAFLLEAMAMGALPVHSDMESVREWIIHGENGLLFPVNDNDALVSCLKQALADDNLIRAASLCNSGITTERLNRTNIRNWLEHIIDTKVLSNVQASPYPGKSSSAGLL